MSAGTEPACDTYTPPGRRPMVTVDPAVCFGRPAVNGVSCEAIVGMVLAGEDLAVAAEEYGLTRVQVLVACWHQGLYGSRRLRRRWGTWARDVAGPVLWKADPSLYAGIPDPPGRDGAGND